MFYLRQLRQGKVPSVCSNFHLREAGPLIPTIVWVTVGSSELPHIRDSTALLLSHRNTKKERKKEKKEGIKEGRKEELAATLLFNIESTLFVFSFLERGVIL